MQQNSRIRILGVDTALRCTGYGVIEINGSEVHAIDYGIIKTPQATYIGSGTPKIKDASLNNFNFPDDLKNIPSSEFDKLKPLIQNYADEAVDRALQNANLIRP